MWPRFERYRNALWLLSKRDLRVRYSTSALGYLWSIHDPLVMAIYPPVSAELAGIAVRLDETPKDLP